MARLQLGWPLATFMELRPELSPPSLDEELVERLAALADAIDGAQTGDAREIVAEFNRVAGTSLDHADFQGIYGAERHSSWVRRLLWKQRIVRVSDVTRAELVEVVRRAMPGSTSGSEQEAYMAIFDANVDVQGASLWIFYPPEAEDDVGHSASVGVVDLSKYEPTAEQIVDWALSTRSRRFMVEPSGDVKTEKDSG